LGEEKNILKEWCEKDELDPNIVIPIVQKTCLLLEEAHKKQGTQFDRTLLEQKKGTDIRLKNSARLLNVLHNKIDKSQLTPDEVQAMSLHNEFLPLVEGFFSTQVNFLILALIAIGVVYESKWKKRAVEGIAEIEEDELANKIKFLKNNQFPEFDKASKGIRNLRNSTGHVFYDFADNGDILVDNERITTTDYEEYYDYLRTIAYAVHYSRILFYAVHFGNLSPADMKRVENVKLEEVKCSCGYVNLLPHNRTTIRETYTCSKCKKPIK
jgi:hypothetical protein